MSTLSLSEKAFQAKRNQILRGAEAVFLDLGYEGASMSRIAQYAAVSKGTLYNHFKDKKDLFREIILSISKNKLSGLFRYEEHFDGACETCLVAICEEFVTAITHPISLGIYRIVVSEAPKFPEISEIMQEYAINPTRSCIRSALIYWCKKQTLQVEDMDQAERVFISLCMSGIVERRRLCVPVDSSAEAISRHGREVVRIFMKIYS